MSNLKKNSLLLAFMSLSLALSAQDRHTLSGYIQDAESGEGLPGVSVYDAQTGLGAMSNTYGFYSLSLPESQDSILVHFALLGMQTQAHRFKLQADSSLNIELQPEYLEEVLVEAKPETQAEQTQMSQISLSAREVKLLPALLGEVDVLKVLQLMPGVQSGEGSSGLYVRGGSPDQNLILLDGVPVYNVYHLFGFFSVFNADAVKSVQLTKGGYPARYGGRLASVLDISLKEGNSKKFQGEGSIGLISSKITLEGPIFKDKTAFIVSARRTYIDVLARPFIWAAQAAQGGNDLGVPGYYFYDLNAKINHKFNEKHRLYLSFYTGQDRFYFKYTSRYNDGIIETVDKTSFGIDWGNLTTALRHNWLINSKLFANTTLTFSRYNFNIRSEYEQEYTQNGQTENEHFAAIYRSGIQDWGLKSDFDYFPKPEHHVRFGGTAIYHRFSPGALNINLENSADTSFETRVGNANLHAGEFSAYVEDDWKLSKAFRMNVGMHASAFAVENKGYASLQPRLALRYFLPYQLALKASFASMTQYIHLLTNEGIGLPTDLWVPSTSRIAPEQSWQAALGLSKSFEGYELSLEGYYRDMRQLIAYKPGASFLDPQSNWEDKVATNGTGQSYGAELFLRKTLGRFTGWLSYTLSWSWRQFEGTEINSGQRYPFKYDRRHNLALTGIYEFSKRVTASAVWVYGTGNATTLPLDRFLAPGQNYNHEIEGYDSKNGYRMAPYHRLDLSVDVHTYREKWSSSWSFGLYNAYSRRNPFFIYSDTDYNGQRVFKQVSLFPLIPSIRWNFKF